MGSFDVAIVGGGMVGAAVAAELARSLTVVLLEAEAEFGVHSTGRSAAMLTQTYGSVEIQQLTAVSRQILEGEFAGPVLRPRPILWTGQHADPLLPTLRGLAKSAYAPRVEWQTPDEAERLAPAVNPAVLDVACLEPDAASIDVDLMQRTFLRAATEHRATIIRNARVRQARRGAVSWEITLDQDTVHAGLLVNAAGAWADDVAALAGVQRAGLVPLRRTVFVAKSVPEPSPGWPFVVDLGERYYFEPAGAQVLVSPSDEAAAVPGHVRADDLDIAACIDRLHERTRLRIRSVQTSWAGLRTFAPDRLPVIGPDPGEPAFVWAAGLGGYGIMTAPAIAGLVAGHVTGSPPSPLARTLAPDRLSVHPGHR